jgi:hypothetical protein
MRLAAPLPEWDLHGATVTVTGKTSDAPLLAVRFTLVRRWRPYAPYVGALWALASLALAPFALDRRRLGARLGAGAALALAVGAAARQLDHRRPDLPTRWTAVDCYSGACLAFVALTLVGHAVAYARPGVDDRALAALAACWAVGNAAVAFRVRGRLRAIRGAFGPPWRQANLVPAAVCTPNHFANDAKLPAIFAAARSRSFSV